MKERRSVNNTKVNEKVNNEIYRLYKCIKFINFSYIYHFTKGGLVRSVDTGTPTKYRRVLPVVDLDPCVSVVHVGKE